MPRATIEVRGREKTWAVTWDAPQIQIDDMRKDGIEVGIVFHTIPAWAVDAGLTHVWCFFQDIWNFRNPFRNG